MSDTSNSAPSNLWGNRTFQKLYWAHVISLLGIGVSSIALGLLAHELVGASASAVLGYTLAIRILVIVFVSPWAGHIGERFGARTMLIWSDLFRVFIVVAFFFVNDVWQIYALAVLLNLGAALFTPIYKAVIPGIVPDKDYPKAVAFGSVAYDVSSILGPALAGLLIATIGFRGSFLFDAFTFLVSAILIFSVPRGIDTAKTDRVKTALWHGIKSMFGRVALRESLWLALQVSVAGAFVLVATIDFIKNDLELPDRYYAWAMALYGIGSVIGALGYSHATVSLRDKIIFAGAPLMMLALALVGSTQSFTMLLVGWCIIGGMQSALGVRGSELLATNSDKSERTHIFAAHFALSHAGWGLTYPLAGYLTSQFGFSIAIWSFVGILVAVTAPYWWQQIVKNDHSSIS